jgi:hypothetical protein
MEICRQLNVKNAYNHASLAVLILVISVKVASTVLTYIRLNASIIVLRDFINQIIFAVFVIHHVKHAILEL